MRRINIKQTAKRTLIIAVALQLLLWGVVRFPVVHAASPNIAITSPTSSSNVPSGPITVTGTAEPTKNVKLYANNALVGTTQVAGNGTWSINTTLSAGINNLRADLYDDPLGYLNVFQGPKSLTKFDASNNNIVGTIPTGLSQANAIVAHPSQALAYVLDPKNATVVVLNSTTNAVVATIDLGTYQNNSANPPTSLAISPDGSKLYVANANLSTITIITTTNNSVGAPVTVGTAPSEMALSDDGTKLYVVDGTHLLVRNATTLASIASINMTNTCYDVVVDGTDDQALVACDNGSGGVITSVDLSNNTVGTTVSYTSGAADSADRLAITADDSLLYAGSHSDDTVQYFDPATMSAGAFSPITGINDPSDIAFTPDGSKAYVASDSTNNIISINTSVNSLTAIDVGVSGSAAPTHVAVKSDGSRALASRSQNYDVALINTNSDAIAGTISSNYNGFSIAITKDGLKGYITALTEGSAVGTLSEVDLVNNSINWSVRTGHGSLGVALSADESKVYVANKEAGTITVVNTATHNISSTISVGDNPFGLVSDTIHNKIFVGDVGGNTIKVVNTTNDTLADTITINNLAGSRGLDISPDGSKIYTVGLDNSDNSLYIIDASSNTLLDTKALPDNASSYDVLVNEAGTKVYIATGSAGKIDVYDIASGSFDTAISTGSFPFGLGITPDDDHLFVTSISSVAVKNINLSDNSVTSFNVNGNPSAFGNFISQALLASTTVSFTSSLANTGERLLTIPLLSIIALSSAYLLYSRRRGITNGKKL
jgi:YVTN family beta-propeller protein